MVEAMFDKLGKLAKVAHEFLFFVRETKVCFHITHDGSMGLVHLPTCTINIKSAIHVR